MTRIASTSMTKIQKLSCIKITKKLMDFPISVFFLNPVDPINDGVPDYFEKVKKPMDLNKVMVRLNEGYYPSIDEWKKDVNLIWKNALLYHTDDSIVFIIAKELQDTFKKMCENIPKTELEMWTCKIKKTHSKLMKLISAKPDSEKKLNLISAGAPKPRKTKILLRQNSNSLG